jgi:hypothetical protein
MVMPVEENLTRQLHAANERADEYRRALDSERSASHSRLMTARRHELDLTARLDAESAKAGILARQNEELRAAIRASLDATSSGTDILGPTASHEAHLEATRRLPTLKAPQ